MTSSLQRRTWVPATSEDLVSSIAARTASSDVATLAPQMAGLIEVGTMPTVTEFAPVRPKFTPPATEFAGQSEKFTPPLHPQHTPIAPSSHPSEIDETTTKISGSVASDAEVAKKALLGKPKKHAAQRSHGSLS